MTWKNIPAKGFILLAALSLADLALTFVLVKYSGGEIYESNPFAGAWLANYGWPGLILFKTLTLAVFISTLVLISIYRPRASRFILGFACVLVGSVAGYSYYLLAHTF
jgi:hypothetical protein